MQAFTKNHVLIMTAAVRDENAIFPRKRLGKGETSTRFIRKLFTFHKEERRKVNDVTCLIGTVFA